MYWGRVGGKFPSGNARYKIGISVKVVNYIEYLRTKIYSYFGVSKLSAYPNVTITQHKGKLVKLYYFQSKNLPIFSVLHSLWYV